MQKLINLKSKSGSALVGAVAICTILSIGIAGLIGTTRNTVNQEADAHDDAKAFLAAESGLLMLTDWVMLNGSAASAMIPRNGTVI